MRQRWPPEGWRIPHRNTNAKYLASSKKRHPVLVEPDSYSRHISASGPARHRADIYTHDDASADLPRPFDYLTHGMAPGLRSLRFAESSKKSSSSRLRLESFRSTTGGTTARRGARRRNAWTSRPCDRRDSTLHRGSRTCARAAAPVPMRRAPLMPLLLGAAFASNPGDIGRATCALSARLVGNEIEHHLQRLTAHGVRCDAPAHYCRAPSIADRTA